MPRPGVDSPLLLRRWTVAGQPTNRRQATLCATAIARVEFIRRCQESGFSLDEIGGILNEDSDQWRTAVDAKLAELRDRRQRLDETIELLTEIRSCGCVAVDQCESFLQ